jgi:hypothetical protein
MCFGIGWYATMDSAIASPRAFTPTTYSGAGVIHMSLW